MPERYRIRSWPGFESRLAFPNEGRYDVRPLDKKNWGDLHVRGDGALLVAMFVFAGALSVLGVWKLVELIIQFIGWL